MKRMNKRLLLNERSLAMKEKFIKPELEITVLEMEDVVLSSPPVSSGTEEGEVPKIKV